MNDLHVNPIDLEIIRHRLEAINADAAETLARVSGSAIASEANDLNTAIMTADGTVVSCSKFIVVQSTSLNLIVRDILENYRENPGIHPGDQFLTNDPYLGVLHQPDVTVVAPVFEGEDLIAWSGSTVHEADVGGPGGGGLNLAARSIFDEATPIPPIKIVEGGVLRNDLQREYLRRSRTPELNALDLLGQVAANRANAERLHELCARYSTATLVAAMDHLVERTEAAFRARLSSMPDGVWRDHVYLEHERLVGDAYLANQVYAFRLALAKRADELEFDYSASDDQAPGAINAGYPTVANATMAAVLVHLCQGLPWVPGAFLRAVGIKTRPGSICAPNWPAGMAMSVGTSCQAIRIVASICIARMLDCSEIDHDKVMAASQSGGAGGMAISGLDVDGRAFSTLLLDEVSGGGGAKYLGDGADACGLPSSPGAAPPNVESGEAYYPMLYLARRELPDSGGPGRYRGGVSTIHAWRPHCTDAPLKVMSMAQGLQHPSTLGVLGGEPGIASGIAVAPRHVHVGGAPSWDTLADSLLIATPTADMPVRAGEVLLSSSQGGGGYGDPLDRDPYSVLNDVREGLVSITGAARDYGVVVGAQDEIELDEAATERLRLDQRRARLSGREPAPRGRRRVGRRLSTHFDLVGEAADGAVVCASCGHRICSKHEPIYNALIMREADVGARFALTCHFAGSERFCIRHFYCPGCGTQVDVHVRLKTEPVSGGMELSLSNSPMLAARPDADAQRGGA